MSLKLSGNCYYICLNSGCFQSPFICATDSSSLILTGKRAHCCFACRRQWTCLTPKPNQCIVAPASEAVLKLPVVYQQGKCSQVWDDELQHACPKTKKLQQTFLPPTSSVFFRNEDAVATISINHASLFFQRNMVLFIHRKSGACKRGQTTSNYCRGTHIFSCKKTLTVKHRQMRSTSQFQE